MNVIDIDREKKSDDSCVSRDKPNESCKKYEKSDESKEESYEAYPTKSLPDIHLIKKPVRLLKLNTIDMTPNMKRINLVKNQNQFHVLKKHHVVQKVDFQT